MPDPLKDRLTKRSGLFDEVVNPEAQPLSDEPKAKPSALSVPSAPVTAQASPPVLPSFAPSSGAALSTPFIPKPKEQAPPSPNFEGLAKADLSQDEIDSLIATASQRRADDVRSATATATQHDPDKYAEAIKIAEFVGANPEAVVGVLAKSGYFQHAKPATLEQLLRFANTKKDASVAITKFVTNPEFARITHDEIDKIVEAEEKTRHRRSTVSEIANAFSRGGNNDVTATITFGLVPNIIYGTLGEKDVQSTLDQLDVMLEDQQTTFAPSENMNLAKRALLQGVEMTPILAENALALRFGPAGVPLIFANSFKYQTSEAFNQYRKLIDDETGEPALTLRQAAGWSMFVGAITAVPDALSMGRILKFIPGLDDKIAKLGVNKAVETVLKNKEARAAMAAGIQKSKFLNNVFVDKLFGKAKTYFLNSIIEGGTEVLQDVLTETGGKVATGKPVDLVGDTLTPENADLFATTFLSTLFIGAPGIVNAPRVAMRDAKAITNAEFDGDMELAGSRDAQKFDTLLSVAENLKDTNLQRRSPSAAASYVDELMESLSDDTVDMKSVSVTAEGLELAFQDNPELLEKVKSLVPDIEEKIEDAKAGDGRVEIKTGAYVSAILSDSRAKAALFKHTSADRTSMTVAEWEKWSESEKAEKERQNARGIAKTDEQRSRDMTTDKIESRLRDIRATTGSVLTAEQGRAQAVYLTSMYATQAKVLDMSLDEFMDTYGPDLFAGSEVVPDGVTPQYLEDKSKQLSEFADNNFNDNISNIAESLGVSEAGLRSEVDASTETGGLLAKFRDTATFLGWFANSRAVNPNTGKAVLYRPRDLPVGPYTVFDSAWATTVAVGDERVMTARTSEAPAFLRVQNPVHIEDTSVMRDTDAFAKAVLASEAELSDTAKETIGQATDIVQIMNALASEGYDGIKANDGGADTFVPINRSQVLTPFDGGRFSRETDALFHEQSTRVPEAKGATEDPLSERLVTDVNLLLNDPETLKSLMSTWGKPKKPKAGQEAKQPRPPVRMFNLLTEEEQATLSDVDAANKFMERATSNILFLYNKMPKVWRARAKLWYVGANRVARAFAERYDISLAQSSALIAVLSPQRDWFQNASLAERTADIVNEQVDTVFTEEMMTVALKQKTFEPGPRVDWHPTIKGMKGKSFRDMSNDERAIFVLYWDSTHNSRQYTSVTPEGAFGEIVTTNSGKAQSIATPSVNDMSKAVSVLFDGSEQNISDALGGNHKVRNFYNNIFNPESVIPFATIDTHAVGGAHLLPMGAEHTEPKTAFGASGSNATLGQYGSYPLYHEAYKRAAEIAGISTREMQSITWEAARLLFPSSEKKSGKKTGRNAIMKIWSEFQTGGISHAEAQDRIFEQATSLDEGAKRPVGANGQPIPGGFLTEPAWVAHTATHDPAEHSTYRGELGQLGALAEPRLRIGTRLSTGTAGGRTALAPEGRSATFRLQKSIEEARGRIESTGADAKKTRDTLDKEGWRGAAVHALRRRFLSRGANETAPRPYGRRGFKRSGVSGPVVKGVTGQAYIFEKEVVDLLGAAMYSAPTFVELDASKPGTRSLFHQAITSAKKNNRHGAAVEAKSLEEYSKDGMRLFITPDGTAGFALTPVTNEMTGADLVSAFTTDDTPHKGAVPSIFMIGIAEGAKRADAFDTVLPEFYGAMGFKSVARSKWNDEFAPDGWDKKTFSKYNNGEPDVVFLAYDPEYFDEYAPGDGDYVFEWAEGENAQRETLEEIETKRLAKLHKVTAPQGTFKLPQHTEADIAFQENDAASPQAGFYHLSENVIEGSKMNSATGKAWLSALKKHGVTDVELDTNDLSEFLNTDKRITKAALLEEFRKTKVRVSVVYPMNNAEQYKRVQQQVSNELSATTVRLSRFEGRDVASEWIEQEIENELIEREDDIDSEAVWLLDSRGITPDNESYDDDLAEVRDDARTSIKRGMREDYYEGFLAPYQNDYIYEGRGKFALLASNGEVKYSTDNFDDLIDHIVDQSAFIPVYPDPAYREPGGEDYVERLVMWNNAPFVQGIDHFDSDEANVVGWYRATTRTMDDGRRYLAVEEFQSDWDRAAHENGVLTRSDLATWKKAKGEVGPAEMELSKIQDQYAVITKPAADPAWIKEHVNTGKSISEDVELFLTETEVGTVDGLPVYITALRSKGGGYIKQTVHTPITGTNARFRIQWNATPEAERARSMPLSNIDVVPGQKPSEMRMGMYPEALSGLTAVWKHRYGQKEFNARMRLAEAKATISDLDGRVHEPLHRGQWHRAVMKAALMDAARQGLDGVAWTPGYAQVRRWKTAMRDKVEQIRWTKTENGVTIVADPVDESKKGPLVHSVTNKKELSRLLGSKMADEIMDSPTEKGVIAGEDMTVAAKFPMMLYDEKMVSFAKKYGKPFGAKYDKRTDDDAPDTEWHSIELTEALTDSLNEKGAPLYQPDAPIDKKDVSKVVNGWFSSNENAIALTRTENATTLIHEASHWYMSFLNQMARMPGAPLTLVKDAATLKQWLESAPGGVQNGDRRASGFTRAQEELFADAVVNNLQTGKAPTPELRGLFRRFRNWFQTLAGRYKMMYDTSKDAIGGGIPEDIRSLIDRMLATEQEIQESKDVDGARPLLTKEASGMTDAEYRRYMAMSAELEEETRRRLDAATFRKLSKEDKQVVARRKGMRNVAAQQAVNKKPKWQVRNFLRMGETPEGLPARFHKLDHQMVLDTLGDDEVGVKLGQRIPKGSASITTTDGDGIAPQMVAEMFGYTSGYDMLMDVLPLTDKMHRQEVRDEVRKIENQEDAEFFGDLPASEATLTSAFENLVVAELTALKKTLGAKAARRPTIAMMKETAKRVVGGARITDTSMARYLQAERRYARFAVAAASKGDPVALEDARHHQLLNAYYYREAVRQQKKVDRLLKYISKFSKQSVRATLGRSGAIDQIDAILANFSFKKSEPLRNQKQMSLEQWLKDEDKKSDKIIAISADAVAAYGKVNWKVLTYDQMDEVVDTVRSIETLGRQEEEMRLGDQRIVVDDIATELEIGLQITQPKKSPGYFDKTTLVDKFSKGMMSLRRMSEEFLVLDGGNEDGFFARTFLFPAMKALNNKLILQNEAHDAIKSVFKGMKLNTRVRIPGTNKSISKESLISIGLNLGNEENIGRLKESVASGKMEDAGITTDNFQEVVNLLDARDWQAIQGVWDYVERFWPQIAALEKRVTGLTPKKVEATPFTNKHGNFRGGYYPISYTNKFGAKAELRQVDFEFKDVAKEQGAFAFAQIDRRFTKERVGSGGQYLRLDLNVLTGHLDDVIHALTHTELMMYYGRLMRDPRIGDRIKEHTGGDLFEALRIWMSRIGGREESANKGAITEGFAYLRRGYVQATLGFKFATVIQQPLGFGQSITRIGHKYAYIGIAKYLRNPLGAAREARNLSTFMANRDDTVNREVNEAFRDTLNGRAMGKMELAGFWGIRKSQGVVDYATWWGAYTKAIDEGASEPVLVADRAVAESQSTSFRMFMGLAEGNRDEFHKALFTFASFFQASYNRLNTSSRLQLQRLKKGDPFAIPKLMSDLIVSVTIPALLGDTLLGRGWVSGLLGEIFNVNQGDDDDDDDESTFLGWAAESQLAYLGSMFPVTREYYSYTRFRAGAPAGYAPTRIFRGINSSADVGAAILDNYVGIDDEQVELKDIEAISGALSIANPFWHYPHAQAWTFIEGLRKLNAGETENYYELLVRQYNE